MQKLYVGNLPYSVTEDELSTTFSQVGKVVSAKVIIDRESGRSKGFGFVEMSTKEEADKAIEGFDGTDYNGRPMTVNIARPMAPREQRDSR